MPIETSSDSRLHAVLYGLVIALFAILPFSIAGANILSGLILIVLLAEIATKKDFTRILTAEGLPLLILLLTALLSAIGAADSREAIISFISPLLKYAVVFLAVSYCLDTTHKFKQFAVTVSVGGAISSIYAIYQFFEVSGGRVTSFFYNPNLAGNYLAVCTVVSLSMFLASKTRLQQAGLALTTIVGLSGTIFTMSRGALLGLGIALIMLGVVMANVLQKKRVLLYIILALVLILLIMPDQVIDRFKKITDLEDSSNHQRILMARGALEIFKQRPILGWGPGNFGILYKELALPGARHFSHPHNIYLSFMTELGLIGLTAFLWLAGILTLRTLKIIATDNRDLQWVIALSTFLSIVIHFVHGFVDTPLSQTQSGLLMCGLAGATAALNKVSEPRQLQEVNGSTE